MRNKMVFTAAAGCLVFLFLTSSSFALTKEEILKTVFGTDTQIVTETKNISAGKLAKMRERLGGAFNYVPKGSTIKFEEKNKADFLFVVKEGKKVGVAVIDQEQGKWGPMDVIAAMDLNGAVKRVEIIKHVEKKGQPVARRSFLSQFEGKNSNQIQSGKDVNTVSGATITSNCVIFAVKKAVALYDELYLK